MCGRYTVQTEEELVEIRDILEELSMRVYDQVFENPEEMVKDYAPTDIAPVFIEEEAVLACEKMRWGFKKWDSKGVVINARSESVEDKTMFRKLTEQRCVVPASGFYEWQHDENNKITDQYLVTDSSDIMFMAGLWRNTENGREYVILTREANEFFADIHSRMPLILYRHQIQDWLTGELSFEDLINMDINRLILKKV